MNVPFTLLRPFTGLHFWLLSLFHQKEDAYLPPTSPPGPRLTWISGLSLPDCVWDVILVSALDR